MDTENDRGALPEMARAAAGTKRKPPDPLDLPPIADGVQTEDPFPEPVVLVDEELPPEERPALTWDSVGHLVLVPPERAGTVTGNTTAAGAVVAKEVDEDEDEEELFEDQGE